MCRVSGQCRTDWSSGHSAGVGTQRAGEGGEHCRWPSQEGRTRPGHAPALTAAPWPRPRPRCRTVATPLPSPCPPLPEGPGAFARAMSLLKK